MANRSSIISVLSTLLAVGGNSVRFSIDAQVDQIFSIIEKAHTSLETSDMKMTMTPADFNYLIPFTVKMTCSEGLMVVHDMKRIHQEDIYMEAINENETYISARFTIADTDFRYELCWLSWVIAVPLWLRGKILQSTYFVTAKISYDPTCEFTITKASLESYEKMTLNMFNWLPGGLGDAVTAMLTRNIQDRIHVTVSESIEKTLKDLATVYDACVAFPAMGRLVEWSKKDDLEEELEESDDPLLVEVEEDALKSGNVVEVGEDEQKQPTYSDQEIYQVFDVLNKLGPETLKDDRQDESSETSGTKHSSRHVDGGSDNQSSKKSIGCSKSEYTQSPSSGGLYEQIRDRVMGLTGNENSGNVKPPDESLVGTLNGEEPKVEERIGRPEDGSVEEIRRKTLEHLVELETKGRCERDSELDTETELRYKAPIEISKSDHERNQRSKEDSLAANVKRQEEGSQKYYQNPKRRVKNVGSKIMKTEL